MLRSLPAALLTLLLAAPAAGAAPVALHDDLAATHVALAGAEVLVLRQPRNGRVRLYAVALDGATRRTVLSLPSRGAVRGNAMLAASPELAGLIVELPGSSGRPDEHRVYTGPPLGPLALVQRVVARDPNTWIPLHIDVDATRLLLVEGRGESDEVRARVLETGGGLVPLPWANARFVPVAVAGDRAAAIAVAPAPGWRADRVALVELLSGAEQAALPAVAGNVPAPVDVDVDASGRIVAELGSRLSIGRAGAPAAAVPDSRSLDTPRFAGAELIAVESARTISWPVLVAADGTRRALGKPTGYVRDITADAGGVAWLANGCVRYATIMRPLPAPPPADPCPTTEIGLYLNNESRLRGRRIGVPVLCITAPGDVCRGTVLIKHRGRVVGAGRFAIRAGRRPRIDARLNRRGLALVRGRNPILRIGARIPDGRIGPSRGVTELLVKVR